MLSKDRKVYVLASRGVYFLKISSFLYMACLLFFSILKIFKSRFLVK